MKKIFLILLLFNISIYSFAKNNSIRRFAVVVGANNGGFSRSRLNYAISDANSFMTVLQELGGVKRKDSFLLFQPDKRNFYSTLRKTYQKIKAANKSFRKTELFFYYSGHSDEEGILLGNEKILYKEIKTLITKIPAHVKITILDSCSSGAFTLLKGGKKHPPFLLDSSYDMKGNAIMTSSSRDEASQESSKIKGSFFTHFLISGLRGAADVTQDNRITLNEAYQFAYNETLSHTQKTLGGPQHANYNIQMSGTGDVVLTDIRKSQSKLILSKNIQGQLYIHDKNNIIISEFYKPFGKETTIALSEGNYKIITGSKRQIYETNIKLKNGKNLIVNKNHFYIAQKEITMARGDKASQKNILLEYSDMTFGGYFSPFVKFAKAGDKIGTYPGGTLAGIINNNFSIGVHGYALAYPNKRKKIKEDSDNLESSEKPYLFWGTIGGFLQYSFQPEKIYFFSLALYFGGGALYYYKEDPDEDENQRYSDKFFVFEPEIKIHFNVFKHLRLFTGISYRFTNGIAKDNFTDKDFYGPSITFGCEAGFF